MVKTKTLKIDEGLHRRLKIEAAKTGAEIQAIVEEAVKSYLTKKK